jgi:alpha/beta superfamily hydrolase
MEKLNDVLSGNSNIKLVGSSFGGLMASICAMENEPIVEVLILLAPAINLIGFSNYELKEISIPVHIYHGVEDDVIPINSVERAAKKYFSNYTFNKVDDDHFLHNTFKSIEWDKLL